MGTITLVVQKWEDISMLQSTEGVKTSPSMYLVCRLMVQASQTSNFEPNIDST